MAEQMAANAQGFKDAAAIYAKAAEGWRRNLGALAGRESSKRGSDAISAARRFVRDGWGEKAAALRWSEIELFGADPCEPWERLDRIGAAYITFTPHAVAADRIKFFGSSPCPMTLWRGAQADGAVLPLGR